MSDALLALFKSWIENARPGSRFVYHEGFLAQDRVRETELFGKKILIPNRTINAIGDLAYSAYMRGQVTLYQRRAGEDDYVYIAEKL